MLRARFTWVERDGTQIHLVPVDDPAVPSEGHTAIVARRRETRPWRPCASTASTRSPGSNAWNAPRWFVHDPAGHRVEVMSAPPPSDALD